MNKLHISPEAEKDLLEIQEYITEELESPQAANNILKKILKRIRSLEKFSKIGAPLSSIIDFDTDYRYLICENYIAFYYINNQDIYVVRVLYGRRDYIKTLFAKLPE